MSLKCDFKAELAIPRPFYCGADKSWRNSFRSGLLLLFAPSPPPLVAEVDDVLAPMVLLGVMLMTGEMAVRLRFVAAPPLATAGGRFGGIDKSCYFCSDALCNVIGCSR